MYDATGTTVFPHPPHNLFPRLFAVLNNLPNLADP
jgi:hypothetical protein